MMVESIGMLETPGRIDGIGIVVEVTKNDSI